MTAGSGSAWPIALHRAERRYQSPAAEGGVIVNSGFNGCPEISLWMQASRIIHAISCASAFPGFQKAVRYAALDGDGFDMAGSSRKSLQMPGELPEFGRIGGSRDNLVHIKAQFENSSHRSITEKACYRYTLFAMVKRSGTPSDVFKASQDSPLTAWAAGHAGHGGERAILVGYYACHQ